VFIIELFLPLNRRDGSPLDRAAFDRILRELTQRFGGVTAFLQAPEEGVWKASDENTVFDQVAVIEVTAENVDRTWWRDYRSSLEHELDQDEILIRMSEVDKL
jgi:hypothetical protein